MYSNSNRIPVRIADTRLQRKAAIAIVVLMLWTAAATAAESPKVIVFPLDGNSSDKISAWVGEGVALSISGQLQARGIRIMERSERIELVESLDLPPGARLSRGSIIRVAQRASADLVVLGNYAGSEQNLKVSVKILDVKALRLSGEISASGPLSVLPQLENELAWLILSHMGLEEGSSREKFQECTRKIPNSAYAYYIESFSRSSESDQLPLLLKAVEQYRDFPAAQFRLGRLYYYSGDCGKAVSHLLLGRNGSGANLENEFMCGTCYLLGDQTAQAIQAFSHVLQISRSLEVLNNMGVAHLRKGDIALALSILAEARALARTDSTVTLNLAIARHLQGNDPAARNLVEEAIKAHPRNGMLHFVLGFLLKAQGESDKASAATGRATSLGVNAEKLQNEDPRTWTRVFSRWVPPRVP